MACEKRERDARPHDEAVYVRKLVRRFYFTRTLLRLSYES